MSSISKPFTFTAGAVIVASQHNSNFDTIYNDYNSNITNVNIASNAAIADSKLAQITTTSKVSTSAITGVLPGANGGCPIGGIIPYAGTSAPSLWLLCNGAAVSRTTYASLFAITSTTWGVGDGSTTFNVPDMRGYFPFGKASAGTGNTLGTSFGSIDHTHTGPSHTHTGPSHTHTMADGDGATGGAGRPATLTTDASGTGATGSSGTGATGTGNPPGQPFNFIIYAGV